MHSNIVTMVSYSLAGEDMSAWDPGELKANIDHDLFNKADMGFGRISDVGFAVLALNRHVGNFLPERKGRFQEMHGEDEVLNFLINRPMGPLSWKAAKSGLIYRDLFDQDIHGHDNARLPSKGHV